MTIQSEAIRAAVAALPAQFNVLEVCDQLPAVPRQCINNVLATMQQQGLLTDAGSETLLHVSGMTFKTRRITVRRFKKSGRCSQVVADAACAVSRTAIASQRQTIVNWDQGARVLAEALAGWPCRDLSEAA